jgi:hypothetical protein
MSSLDCSSVISDSVTRGSVVFDIAEDLVRAAGIEGRLSPMLD